MFLNRNEAGKKLGRALRKLELDHPIVVALPNGGVPVGYEVALALGAPLDVLLVKKIGHPRNPEFAIGAISEGGLAAVNEELIYALGVEPADLEKEVRELSEDVRGDSALLRAGIPPVDLKGRTVVLVDEGIATGASMLLAIDVLQRREASRIVVATPVCPADAAQLLQREDIELVALDAPEFFVSVNQWYRSFPEVSRDEITGFLVAARAKETGAAATRSVTIEEGRIRLEAEIGNPEKVRGWVIFAHGSGSSRRSPRNRQVAEALNRAGFATVLFDLLMPQEDREPNTRFDIPLLADRLVMATFWLRTQPFFRDEPIGYFGASTGAAAALLAAERPGNEISAVVSRGGRPDLAADVLERVPCPVLLIVGGEDEPVLGLNRDAKALLRDSELLVIPGATHLFEEPGKMEKVEEYSIRWFSYAFRRNTSEVA